MARPDGGDSGLPNEVCDIINCIATYICYEKDRCERECLYSERKILIMSPDFKESEDAESFEKKLLDVFTGHPLQGRIHTGFHRFTEIGQIFQNYPETKLIK